MPTVQYIPRENGGYQPYAKLPTAGKEPAQGEQNLAYIQRGTRAVSVVDGQGEELFSHSGQDYLQSVQYQPVADRYLIQDYSGVDVISAQDGALQGRITPDHMDHQSRMQVLNDGRLVMNCPVIGEKGQLIMLQPDLQPAWHHETDLHLARVLDLGEGRICASDGRNIEVCDAQGNVIHRSVKAVCDPQFRDGKLIYLEAAWMKVRGPGNSIAERSNAVVLCQHDLKTGVTVTTPTTDNCERITLVPDGKVLLSERKPGWPMAMVLHDAQGNLEHRFELPEGRCLFQVELSADGKSAYAFEGWPLDKVYTIHRADLESKTMEPVFHHDDMAIVRSLSDGHTAVFTRQGVTLLEDGTRLATPRDLLEHVGKGVQPAHNSVESRVASYFASEPGPGRWDELFDQVQRNLDLPSAARLTAEPGKPFSTPDCALNFMLPAVDALPASVAAASRPLSVGDLFRDSGLPAWMTRSPQKITVKDTDGKEHSILARKGDFTHILPFTTEGRPVVAAARANQICWWDPTRSSTEVSYDLGEPALSLEPGQDGRSVIAKTASGQVLHLVPEGAGTLGDDPKPAEDDKPAGGIQQNADGIRLPGVFIRRYKR